jgi:hypothetical protein
VIQITSSKLPTPLIALQIGDELQAVPKARRNNLMLGKAATFLQYCKI